MPVTCAECGCSAARYLDHGTRGTSGRIRLCYECAAKRAQAKRERLASEPPTLLPGEEEELEAMLKAYEADPEGWQPDDWYPRRNEQDVTHCVRKLEKWLHSRI
jgi:hypothetical protein